MPIAPRWLILQALGALIMALGVSESVGVIQLMPDSWRFPYYGWVIFTIGLLLELPASIGIMRQARHPAQKSEAGKVPGTE